MSAGSTSVGGAAERRRFVNVAAAITATGGLLFGYDTGVISGALLFIRQDFGTTPFTDGVIVAFILVGAMVGAFSGGPLSDRIGRRPTTLVAAVIFAVGALVVAFTPSVAILVLGRFVLGVGVGLASMIVPLYIAEIAPAARRGGLVSLNQLAITIGILLSYIVGVIFAPIEGWRWMFGVALVPAIVLFVGMFGLPESPRWLFNRGQLDKARQVLGRSRSEQEVEQEMQEMDQIKRQESQQSQAGVGDLLSPYVRPALIIGVGLAIFQQITGINTIIYYAPTILENAGFSQQGALVANALGVGLVNVGFTILAVRIIDRVGRRPLLLIGLVGMTVSLALLAIVFTIGGETVGVGLGLLATLCLALYIASFAISLGPVFWLMISEIYPLRVRGTAMGTASIANWGSNFIVALIFPVLLTGLGGAALFWIFAGIAIVAWIFIFSQVPETKGRSLEEIEASFRGVQVASGGSRVR